MCFWEKTVIFLTDFLLKYFGTGRNFPVQIFYIFLEKEGHKDMSKLIFDRGNFTDFTSISNVFVDEYMPTANGEFVKIYLLLLRLVNTGCEDLSIPTIADTFNILESDVVRALKFWSRENLLSLSLDEDGSINGIKLEALSTNRYIVRDLNNKLDTNTEVLASAAGESAPIAVPTASGIIVPNKKKYSPREVEAFSDNEDFQQIKFLAETYLGKLLTPTEIDSILYILDGLQLSADFIEYVMESCISSGQKSLSYIEKQIVFYFEKDIRTLKELKDYLKLQKDISKSIYKAFGLDVPARPIKREMSYITKWTDELDFSDEFIIEACNRSAAHASTNSGKFSYADSILLKWSEKNVTSMADIEKLDKEHKEESQKIYSAKAKVAKKISRPKNVRAIESRNYNHQDFEKQLIMNRKEMVANISSKEK